MLINNDRTLRQALDQLSLTDQRLLGARFVNSVIQLTDNSRLAGALEVAMEPESDEQSRNDAYKVARSITTKTYTACGRDADWSTQAEHFVAAACAAVLTPEALLTEGGNPAWKAAIQARMAKNCLLIDQETDDLSDESARQYQLAQEFIHP